MPKTYIPVPSRGTITGGLIIGVILAIPFLLSAYFLLLGPVIFSLSLLSLFLFVLAFMGYLIYSGINMRYVVGDEDLTLKIGFHERKIPYSDIKGIRPENLSLVRLRIFGASWPGYLWGLFSVAGIGKVHLYCTKWRGEFVLIELLDGERMGITPQQQMQFIDEVRDKLSEVIRGVTEERVPKPKAINGSMYLQIIAVIAAYIALTIYVLYIYPTLPAIIPVHFDLYGNPNRWAPKSELYGILLLAAIFPVLNSLIILKFGKDEKVIAYFLGITFLLIIVLFFGTVDWIVRASI